MLLHLLTHLLISFIDENIDIKTYLFIYLSVSSLSSRSIYLVACVHARSVDFKAFYIASIIYFLTTYFINQLMWLNVKNIQIKKFFKKLEVKKYESYKILKRLSRQVYRLKLFSKMHIHSIFNVSLLKSFCLRKKELNELLMKDLELKKEIHDSWKINNILNSCIQNDQLQYLLSWKNFKASENIWESSVLRF